MSLPSFSEFYHTVKTVEECLDESEYLEDFFDHVELKGLQLETVMTSDIAQMTLPVGMMKVKRPVSEVAPEDPRAEAFIKDNKTAFKKRYGDNWKQVLYATAWKLFGNSKD